MKLKGKYFVLGILLTMSFRLPLGRAEKLVGTYYLNSFFAHLHQNPSSYSQSLTTLSCGQPIKLYKTENTIPQAWSLVETVGKRGYIFEKYLSPTMPRCFERSYPEFFNRMELKIEEIYYWGKIFDQYNYSEVRLP